MRVAVRPDSLISARTLSGPTAAIATSVAVLSLWAIMASSTLRAGVVPVRFRNTGLLTERTASSIGRWSLSDSRPASTSRRYCARMKVLIALPMNSTARDHAPPSSLLLGSAASIRQLAVAGSAAKRSMADVTPAVGPAARAGRTAATEPAAAAAISKARRLTSMGVPPSAKQGVSLAKRERG
jgi:hypothetical protein